MKTELLIKNEQGTAWEKIKRLVNPLLFPLYLAGAHWYDGICAYISIKFTVIQALFIMLGFLFLLSVVFVWLHGIFKRKWSWDLMGLEEFKRLKNEKEIPWWRIFKRLNRWALKNRKTSFWAGNILIGPPVISVLLRKEATWKENIRYISCGTFISVFFWVVLWKVFSIFIWEPYIRPFLGL